MRYNPYMYIVVWESKIIWVFSGVQDVSSSHNAYFGCLYSLIFSIYENYAILENTEKYFKRKQSFISSSKQMEM